MASTTSENRKRNEKKSTEQEEAHFVSQVTVILTREKERDYLLNLHMSQSTCFGTWIKTGVDFYGWQWVPRASTVQKGEHVKDNRAKRSNVEVTSIVGGRLLSLCVCVCVCVCVHATVSMRPSTRASMLTFAWTLQCRSCMGIVPRGNMTFLAYRCQKGRESRTFGLRTTAFCADTTVHASFTTVLHFWYHLCWVFRAPSSIFFFSCQVVLSNLHQWFSRLSLWTVISYSVANVNVPGRGPRHYMCHSLQSRRRGSVCGITLTMSTMNCMVILST